MFGFLRESQEDALKAGVDEDTGLSRTGLEYYLQIIFPDVSDWVHDKPIGGPNKELSRKRPDYRSETLKLIVEFDGLPHYQSPKQIREDQKRTALYVLAGYKVVRIPYFIQLTRKAVIKLFGVDVGRPLFPEGIPSLGIHTQATPAYLCIAGIERMAREFKGFPDQYTTNVRYLRNLDDSCRDLNGVDYLEYFYCRVNS